MSRKNIGRVLIAFVAVACALLALLRPTAREAEMDAAAAPDETTDGASLARAAVRVDGPAALPRASISGRVFDKSRGIPDATVCLVCGDCDLMRSNDQGRCAQSDANGMYTLSEVAAGSYRLSATADGYQPSVLHGGAPFSFSGAELTGQDIELARGGAAVRGVVLDATGGTISAATVRVHFGLNWRSRGRALALARKTDDNGEFTIYVPEGSVGVMAESEGYAGAAVIVQAPARDVRLVLTPGASVAGTVLDRTRQKPVANVVVTARGDVTELRATSDASGKFTLQGMRPGLYDLDASGPRWIGRGTNTIAVDLGDSIKDVTVFVSHGSRVTGVLRVGERACDAGTLHLTPAPGEELPRLVAYTKPGGLVEFEAVPPGSYESFMFCDRYGAKRGQSIKVPVADLEGIEWRMDGGAEVTVHVQSPERKPVTGAWVSLVRDAEGLPPDPISLAPKQLQSDPDGTARFVGVLPGRYEIRGPQLAESQKLTVSESDPTLEATVTLRPVGSIEVLVTDVKGQPNDAVAVAVEPVQPGEGRFSEVGAPRGDGRYLIGPMVAGDYRVSVRDRVNPTKEANDGTAVAVRSGEVANVRIRYGGHGGSITGLVRDHAGSPVANAWVSASASAEPDSDRDIIRTGSETRSLTDVDGRFTIAELDEAGVFTVTASHSLGGRVRAERVAVGRHIELALRSPGKLQGEVRTRLGEPPSHFRIVVRNDEQRQTLSPEFGPEAQGRWEIDDVAPGELEISASAAEGFKTFTQTLAPAQELGGLELTLEKALPLAHN